LHHKTNENLLNYSRNTLVQSLIPRRKYTYQTLLIILSEEFIIKLIMDYDHDWPSRYKDWRGNPITDLQERVNYIQFNPLSDSDEIPLPPPI